MSHADAPLSPAVERFNALIRESKLNCDPDADIRQYRIGLLASELIWCKAATRKAEILKEMGLIRDHQTIAAEEARAERRAVKSEPPGSPPRLPMLDLVHELIDASIERARLGIPPPDCLRSVGRPPSSGPIGAMDLDTLRMSLRQSAEAVQQHQNGATP